MKKRGFGVGHWNGAGGKVEPNETILEAAKRETKEEINIDVHNLKHVATLTFRFNHTEPWNQIAHTFLCESWSGEPQETEEMKPQWFQVDAIPYNQMWEDDIFWLPHVLNDQHLTATFTFDKDNKLIDKSINIG